MKLSELNKIIDKRINKVIDEKIRPIVEQKVFEIVGRMSLQERFGGGGGTSYPTTDPTPMNATAGVNHIHQIQQLHEQRMANIQVGNRSQAPTGPKPTEMAPGSGTGPAAWEALAETEVTNTEFV